MLKKKLTMQLTIAFVMGAVMCGPQLVDAANLKTGQTISNGPVVSNRPTKSTGSSHRMTVKEKAAQISGRKQETMNSDQSRVTVEKRTVNSTVRTETSEKKMTPISPKEAKRQEKERMKAEKQAAKEEKKRQSKQSGKSTVSDSKKGAASANNGWRTKVAQKNLKTLGYSSETPNGKLTDTTKKSLEHFQKDNNLKASGELDDATYKKLNWKAFEKTGISSVSGSQVVSQASKYKGVPYVFGGTTPKGFDCSGYVQHVFKNVKANLPRLADAQAMEGIFVTQNQLKPGDLVFFSTYEPGASHVGIYAGNHQFWNATSSRGVMLSSLKEDYWRSRYYGARRVLIKNGEIK